jgi:hypothetical protein
MTCWSADHKDDLDYEKNMYLVEGEGSEVVEPEPVLTWNPDAI